MTAASKPTKKITRRATGGNLPQWDLGDFYPEPSSPRIKSDLGKAHRRARAFRKRHEGRLAGLGGSAFGAAIAEFERIGEIVSRIMSYAQLLLAADVGNTEVAQKFEHPDAARYAAGRSSLRAPAPSFGRSGAHSARGGRVCLHKEWC